VLIRHLRQLKTVVFFHWCLTQAHTLNNISVKIILFKIMLLEKMTFNSLPFDVMSFDVFRRKYFSLFFQVKLISSSKIRLRIILFILIFLFLFSLPSSQQKTNKNTKKKKKHFDEHFWVKYLELISDIAALVL
jgi:hypothetical protein